MDVASTKKVGVHMQSSSKEKQGSSEAAKEHSIGWRK